LSSGGFSLANSRIGRALGARPVLREVTTFAEEIARTAALTLRPRADIEEVRGRRLERVLRAAAHTRFYGGVIDDEVVRSRALSRVPPVTKAQFLSRLSDTIVDDVVSENTLHAFVRAPERAGTLLEGKYLVAMTSGTTGQVGIFVNDVTSWAETRAVTFARIFRQQLNARDVARAFLRGQTRMVFVVATGGHYMTALLASRVPAIGRAMLESSTLSVEMPLPVLVARLNDARPHILHSYPTVLELLANEAKAGRLRIAPEIVTSGSERLSLAARESIKAAFSGAQLVETYAATECVHMASSCAHGVLHLNDDACILEPVDDDDRPVPPGAVASRVLVTNLLNVTQPLVRYALTDQIEVLTDPCACGTALSSVRVHGRTDDTFFLQARDGSFQAHPPIPLELIFLSVAGLLQYQLVHETQNTLRVLFVVEKGALGAQVAALLDEKLSRYLTEHDLFDVVRTSLEQVEAITRSADSKKIRQIISHAPPPHGVVRAAPEVRERRRRPRTDP
jgi:phenylacetate-CoA ligase